MKRKRETAPAGAALSHTTTLRVRFSEVDSMSVVWHGEYVRYFEDGREAFGERYPGLGYLDIYASGYTAPIVALQVDYRRPLRIAERAEVETRYIPTEAAKICFEYTIRRASDGEVVATGSTTQVFVNAEGELELTAPQFSRNGNADGTSNSDLSGRRRHADGAGQRHAGELPRAGRGAVRPAPRRAALPAGGRRELCSGAARGACPRGAHAARERAGALRRTGRQGVAPRPGGDECALVISTTKGNVSLLEGRTTPPDEAFLYTSACRVARRLGITRPPVVVSNACISGVTALIVARRMILNGECAHVIVAGATC